MAINRTWVQGAGTGDNWGWGYKLDGPIVGPDGSVASTGDLLSGEKAKASTDNFVNRLYIARTLYGNQFRTSAGKAVKIDLKKLSFGERTRVKFLARVLTFTKPMHFNMFMSRKKAIDDDLKDGYITEEQAKYRLYKAVDKYNSYLVKKNFYTPKGYLQSMSEYAKKQDSQHKYDYVMQQVLEESAVGREAIHGMHR